MFLASARSYLSSSLSSSMSCESRHSDSTHAAPSLSKETPRGLPWIEKLPCEIMLRIFIEVITSADNNFRWIAVLSRVSQRWYVLCQHPLLWQFVAKRIFVVYPLVIRLQHDSTLDPPLHGSSDKTHLTTSNEQSAAPHDSMELLLAPTRSTLQSAMEEVSRHKARQQYYKYVQRRRSFVLHFFLSLTLLTLSLSIGAALCSAEHFTRWRFCSKNVSFAFLWISYLSIAAIIVSNVIMQAHFEPQPLLMRIRRNRILISASTATLLLGLCDVIVPTLLVQINLSREQRFSWIWCGATVIASFIAWQAYAVICIMPDAKEQFQLQLNAVNLKEGFQFVMINIPNAFPLLFAAAAFCTSQYAQYGSRLYVYLGCVPVTVSLAVLSLVFLLDFCALHRPKDLAIGVCLCLAMFFPVSLLFWDFRGWSLLPLGTAIFGFFLSHARYGVWMALQDLLDSGKEGQLCTAS